MERYNLRTLRPVNIPDSCLVFSTTDSRHTRGSDNKPPSAERPIIVGGTRFKAVDVGVRGTDWAANVRSKSAVPSKAFWNG